MGCYVTKTQKWMIQETPLFKCCHGCQSIFVQPATSGASEFFKCGLVVSDWRSKISPLHMEQIVFVSQNLWIFVIKLLWYYTYKLISEFWIWSIENCSCCGNNVANQSCFSLQIYAQVPFVLIICQFMGVGCESLSLISESRISGLAQLGCTLVHVMCLRVAGSHLDPNLPL